MRLILLFFRTWFILELNGSEIVVCLCSQRGTWNHVKYSRVISGIPFYEWRKDGPMALLEHGKGTFEGGNKGLYHSFQSVPYSDSIVTCVC